MLKQNVSRDGTERVDEKEYMHPMVGQKTRMQSNGHAQASIKCKRSQCSFKRLFQVGSFVLERTLCNRAEPNLNPLRVVRVLGWYKYVLLDGRRWSAWCLVYFKKASKETVDQGAADQ